MVITSVTGTVRVSVPLVPVTVSVFVPVTVLDVAVTVRVEEVVLDGLGLNEADAPVGSPLTESDTAPVNPPVLAMLMV